ncbi:MAG: YhdP family protein, partial [Burkholderiales bacterium]
RAELRGASLLNLGEWNGSAYAYMDSANLAAWKAYLPLPAELQKGTGGVQAWVAFEGSHITDSVADLQLSDVSAKFKPELPPLALESLNGRLSYRERASGFNFSGKNLDFTLANSKTNVPEADYFFQYYKASEKLAPSGELLASALDIEALRQVADTLPFDAVHRKRLDQFAPRGRAENLALKWSGEPDALQTYSIKLKFSDVSVAAVDDSPGLTNMNGDFDASEKGGTLSLNNKASEISLANIFAAPLKFDSLNVQTSWKKIENKYEVNLEKILFANADTTGQVSGKYTTLPNSPGRADIKANFKGINANDIYRYIPLKAGEDVRKSLQASLKSGRAENIALDVKGNLADFPFENDKNGLFHISAKIVNADLDYAERWPKVENINGDFALSGMRLEIHATNGMIAKAKILRTDAIIADLNSADPVLKIKGRVAGAIQDKIRFLNTSPVNQMIDGFTQGMKATGNGALDLQLALPLAHIKDTKASGEYHFENNHIEGGKIWPALDNVTGVLSFDAAGVQIKNIAATAFGGPVTISVDRQTEGNLVVDAAGKANIDEMLALMNIPAQDWMEGTTDWTAKAVISGAKTAINIDSTMLGISSSLPQPLNKSAAVAMPLHVERKTPAADQELYEVTLGKEMSGAFLRSQDGKGEWRMRKGTLAMNTNAALSAKDGFFVTGALDELDIDLWRSYLRKVTKPGVTSGAVPSALGLRGFDLTVSKLIALDKVIGVTRVSAELNGTAWQSNITSNDFNGTLTWKPEGQGTIIARFKNFAVPESIDAKPQVQTPAPGVASPPTEVDFPALDIIADEFRSKKHVLGRLELQAKPEAHNWRLEKLRLLMPDATLEASGLWQGLPAKPNTTMEMKLEVRDIGRFLAHMGQPDSVKGGTSNLSGKLTWAGDPYDFAPTILSGNFRLEAVKGQFLQIPSSGAGKLLSLISLQALPRRIALDFRDVFSSGFIFDDMAGSFVVDKGLMSTNDFVINGTAAIVTMEGSVNLAQENQNLRVKIIPAASDTVSIATTLLGGPVAGIVSYVLQKWLKNPFGEIAAFQYAITGTWDDPQVNKIQQASATQTPGGWE